MYEFICDSHKSHPKKLRKWETKLNERTNETHTNTYTDAYLNVRQRSVWKSVLNIFYFVLFCSSFLCCLLLLRTHSTYLLKKRTMKTVHFGTLTNKRRTRCVFFSVICSQFAEHTRTHVQLQIITWLTHA